MVEATYSTSQLDKATMLCFLLHHESAAEPGVKQKPLVERLSFTSLAQSACTKRLGFLSG